MNIQHKAISAESASMQIVTFAIDDKLFGVEVEKVREIKGWQTVTPLPHSPRAVLGVINLRGMILPVYDLRSIIGMNEAAPTHTHVIIVIDLGTRTAGILVDAVSDIIDIQEADIKDAPDLGSSMNYVRGIIVQEKAMVTLLNMTPVMDEQGSGYLN